MKPIILSWLFLVLFLSSSVSATSLTSLTVTGVFTQFYHMMAMATYYLNYPLYWWFCRYYVHRKYFTQYPYDIAKAMCLSAVQEELIRNWQY